MELRKHKALSYLRTELARLPRGNSNRLQSFAVLGICGPIGPSPVQSRDRTFKHYMQLKRKSDAFEAFKTYKAFAENYSQKKMKEFQDDKRGEYMSAAFIKFTDVCGIH